MAEREASGDFDYLIGDLADAPQDTDVSSGDAVLPEIADAPGVEDISGIEWDDSGEEVWYTASEPADGADGAATDAFDAFDADTWYFEPAPAPWYRSKQALVALVAAAAASVALVVSAVLLVFRAPGDAVEQTTPATSTVPTTALSTQLATTSRPAPPPPPPTSAEPVDPGTAGTFRQRPSTRATKEPEIGVTRTPVTRSPISVAPQPRGPR